MERSFNGIEFGGIDTRERQELSDFGMLSQTSSATLFTRFAIFKEKHEKFKNSKIKNMFRKNTVENLKLSL